MAAVELADALAAPDTVPERCVRQMLQSAEPLHVLHLVDDEWPVGAPRLSVDV